ncbi:MAG: 6-phosphogluconolactonase [Candidatus Diapherotrites archaeon CG11_big_fil_rev_8_21_14_0_20_37_9]|nr:MAG: 6-phosphogluconolactonase [Candidatus Diapherotrites archaeon CG11_big_fil_rev_8_21_14_0_20_37_9]
MLKEIHCLTQNELSKRAAGQIAKIVQKNKGKISIAFPGGRSVTGILKELASKKINWDKTEFFLTDERVVSKESDESNFLQFKKLFLNKINKTNEMYTEDINTKNFNSDFEKRANGKIDLIILGTGEDGHIASLFPKNKALANTEKGYIAIKDSPKPPKERITLSPETIGVAKDIILIFVAPEKKQAYNNFIEKNKSVSECPAKIALKAKNIFVYTAFGD